MSQAHPTPQSGEPFEHELELDASMQAFCERAGRILRDEPSSDAARLAALDERIWQQIELEEQSRAALRPKARARGVWNVLERSPLGRAAAALLAVQFAAVPVLAWIALRPAPAPAALNISFLPVETAQNPPLEALPLESRPGLESDPGRFENRARLDRLRFRSRSRGLDPKAWAAPTLEPALARLIDLRLGSLAPEELPVPTQGASTLERAALLELWLDAWAKRPDVGPLDPWLPRALLAPLPARAGESQADREFLEAALARAAAYGAGSSSRASGSSEPSSGPVEFWQQLEAARPDWVRDTGWKARFESVRGL